MRLVSFGRVLVVVAVFGVAACGGSSTSDGDVTTGSDVDAVQPAEVADGVEGDPGKDAAVVDALEAAEAAPDGAEVGHEVAEVAPDGVVPDAVEADVAEGSDASAEVADTAAEVPPETVDPMDELFEGIREACRPADLGCSSDEACEPPQACVGGACQAPVAPADYTVDAVRFLSGVRLPAAHVGSGFDLNGDGEPDNRVADTLGLLPGRTAMVNDTFTKYIDSGVFTYLAAFRDVPADGCGPLSVAIVPATGDLDLDGLPDGSGQYQVLASGFRVDGSGRRRR